MKKYPIPNHVDKDGVLIPSPGKGKYIQINNDNTYSIKDVMTKNEEMKTFNFCEYKDGVSDPVVIEVREEDLTESQIDLLLGNLIKNFEDMPEIVRDKFVGLVVKSIVDNISGIKQNELYDLISKKYKYRS